MRSEFRTTAAIALAVAGLSVAGCGGSKQQGSANGDIGTPSSAAAPGPSAGAPASDTTATRPHHSTLAGAAVGAVVGHELGGHAAAGAAAGALIQHHRNKKSH
jgi:hypothetical protein